MDKTAFTKLDVKHNGEWAELLWRPHGDKGGFRFIVLSSYGCWSYYFVAGCSPESFLAGLNRDYLGQKFFESNYWKPCPIETGKLAKEHILSMRRHGSIDNDMAREEYDLTSRLIDDDLSIDAWIGDTEIEDAYELISSRRSNTWACFWKYLWEPAVVPALENLSVSDAA